MLIWENSDLFCDVWWWRGVGLITLRARQRETGDGGWVRQSITEWNQFWSLIPEQLSSLTKNLITGASSIISNCSDCHSDKIYVLSRPAHFALCLCYYPKCKSVRLSPPYIPVNLSASGNRDAGLWFPGPTPALHIRSLVSPHPHLVCPLSRYL